LEVVLAERGLQALAPEARPPRTTPDPVTPARPTTRPGPGGSWFGHSIRGDD